MQPFTTLILVVCSALAGVGLITYAVAKYRNDKATVTIEAKNELIDTYEKDAARDNTRIEVLEKQHEADQARIDALESENRTLREVLPREIDWQAMQTAITTILAALRRIEGHK